jgi:S-ribosylhomocysteine lyase
MNKITSFTVDHTKFGVGMYISRIDGDVVTYDVRMTKPNGGDYLTPKSLHTIEHIFATFARNSALTDSVLYVGPMGCRTGFYVLMRGTSDTDKQNAIALVRDSLEYVSGFSGELPGNSIEECGNYLEHDLDTAKLQVLPLLEVLKQGYDVGDLVYPV